MRPSTTTRTSDAKMSEDTYPDLGAVTPQAREIYNTSRKFIAKIVGDRNPEDKIRQRCVIATGDLSIAETLRFVNDPVGAGLRTLDKGAGIYADIKMVEAGIVKKSHRCPVTTFIGRGDELAEREGITRTSAGVIELAGELSGSIVVIGNAPSALMTLCELMEEDRIRPELVIGVPVGFVNATESKERLRKIDVPSVSTVGTRGGTPIAVAAINEIINMHHVRADR